MWINPLLLVLRTMISDPKNGRYAASDGLRKKIFHPHRKMMILNHAKHWRTKANRYARANLYMIWKRKRPTSLRMTSRPSRTKLTIFCRRSTNSKKLLTRCWRSAGWNERIVWTGRLASLRPERPQEKSLRSRRSLVMSNKRVLPFSSHLQPLKSIKIYKVCPMTND